MIEVKISSPPIFQSEDFLKEEGIIIKKIVFNNKPPEDFKTQDIINFFLDESRVNELLYVYDSDIKGLISEVVRYFLNFEQSNEKISIVRLARKLEFLKERYMV